jgi:RNA-directed DNA polymerase
MPATPPPTHPEQGRWLASVVRGHLAYYAVPGNSDAMGAFRNQAIRHWFQALRRRSQRTRLTWKRMYRLATRCLPPAHILHPSPRVRFDARTPRQQPSAVVPHAGICAGAARKGGHLAQ